MYISSDINDVLNRFPRTFCCELEFLDDLETLDVDIVEFEYENGCTSEENLTLGAAVSAFIKVKMIYNEYDFTKPFSVKLGVFDTEDSLQNIKYCPVGNFAAVSVESDADNCYKTITAYDVLTYKCEKVYISDLTYPTSYRNVISEIYRKAGIGIFSIGAYDEVDSEENLDIQMPVKKDGYTFRTIIGYIAGILGGFAYADKTGKVKFKDFKMRSTLTVGENLVFSDNFTVLKNIIVEKCIIYRNETLNYTHTYAGIIPTPLVRKTLCNTNPLMHSEVFNCMKENVTNIVYHPLKATFIGNPVIDVGDKITIGYSDRFYSGIAMRIVHKYDGGLTTTVESYGISYEEDSKVLKDSIQQIKSNDLLKALNISEDDTGMTHIEFGGFVSAKKTFQSGCVSVNCTANAVSSVDVEFDVEMLGVPAVIITAGSSGPYTAIREVTVSNVTSAGFTVNVYRTNAVTTGVYWFAHCNVRINT